MAADNADSSSQADRPKKQILVVDDDDSLLDALFSALSEDPTFEIAPCSTFEQARRRLMEQSFDVLITDVRLGAFNGLQLAVLAKDVNARTQLIVISGFDDPVLREETERLGGTYVLKPVGASALLRLIGTGGKSRTEVASGDG